MTPTFDDVRLHETRRQFFGSGTLSLGAAALASLLGGRAAASTPGAGVKTGIGAGLPLTHFAPKAKNVIYLHMLGGPSQMDLYDYKPKMVDFYDKDLPDSVRKGQRLTTMTSGQKPGSRSPARVSTSSSPVRQERHVDVSEVLAAHGQDDRRRVLHPQYAHRGHQPRAGHHLHADRQPGDRPAVPRGVGQLRPRQPEPEPPHLRGDGGQAERTTEQVQAISARLWQSGYLPGEHSAWSASGRPATRSCTSTTRRASPTDVRRTTLDGLGNAINAMTATPATGDPDTLTRIKPSTRWPSACRPASPS